MLLVKVKDFPRSNTSTILLMTTSRVWSLMGNVELINYDRLCREKMTKVSYRAVREITSPASYRLECYL